MARHFRRDQDESGQARCEGHETGVDEEVGVERDGENVRKWWQWARMGAAITADSPEADRFAELGKGSYLAFPQGVLDSIHRIRIGAGCVINEHVTLAAGLASTEPGAPRIVIRDRCVLGRGTEILALGGVELGEDVWTASRVTIVDHNHRTDQPDTPVARQLPLRIGRVTIGRGSVLSTGATILAGAHIGPYSMVAAGAVVRAGFYPDHALLAGVPARITQPGSSPTYGEPEPIPFAIPPDLPVEHPDPNVQHLINHYLDAHTTAAQHPAAHTYHAAGERAVQLQAALATAPTTTSPDTSTDHAELRTTELRHALFDQANEYARQAALFPTPHQAQTSQ